MSKIKEEVSIYKKTNENVVDENKLYARERRKASTGSVYPIKKTNRKGEEIIKWGFCLCLNNASAEQKKYFGNRLRYLKSNFSRYEEAVAGVEEAISNIDKILEEKLKNLGWGECDDIKTYEK